MRDLPGRLVIADALFRRRFYIGGSALLLLLVIGAVWQWSPRKYEAQTVLLVRNNRAEVVLTPGQTPGSLPLAPLNEGQIATEAQLLMSRSSLRQVVTRAGLAAESATGGELDKAVRKLEKEIKVIPNPKASLITVRYAHEDAQRAAKVVEQLLAIYMDQHIRVHQSAGTDFFEQQATDQGKRLRAAQERLAKFQQNSKIVLLHEQKEMNLRRMMEIEAAHREAKVAYQEGQERVSALSKMVAQMTPRITTQMRTVPNQYLVERLQTMLVDLKNRRTDLLAKFRSDDRLVQQVEQQLADTQASLDRALKLNATEQASDVNPLRQSLEADLARAQMGQKVLRARIGMLGDQIRSFQREITGLERATASYNDLLREVKSLEENYQLYSRKWEEVRIASALDREKIANVTIVEKPEVPSEPAPRSLLLPAGAMLLGLVLILCVALLSGVHGQELHTPEAIFQASGLQVLATIPERSKQR